MIIDTHTHYDDKAFDADRDTLLKSFPEAGIESVVNIGASIASTKQTLELMKHYPFVYGAAGVHPSETAQLDEKQIDWLLKISSSPKIVAIGEIGLDYYWEEPGHSIQKHWFAQQMDLARQAKLPVVIHSRDAAKDTLDMMKAENASDLGGVIHCFSYPLEIAREFLNMGFYLGIGGVLTFNNAKKLKEVVSYMPMDRIVLETDCPYLSPAPNRGKRNSSLNLPYVIKAISELKNVSEEEIISATNRNAKELYHM